MNNLKFRQFLPTDFHPEGEFMYWGYGVMSDANEFVPPSDPSAPSEQWTGLSDKNGIKIYAGDYVVCPERIHQGDEGVVEYSHTGQYVLAQGSFKSSLHDLVFNKWNLKIIGNIHENPELLS